MWGWYTRALEAYPLLSRMGTACVLMTFGDILSQTAIEKRIQNGESLDLERIGRAATIGFFINGPMLTYWYKFLDRTFLPQQIFRKLLMDQTLFAPTIVSTFFLANGMMQGKDVNMMVKKLQNDLPKTMVANWTVWPAAMLINFKFVPPPQRVLYTSTVALLWNTYLTTVGNKHH